LAQSNNLEIKLINFLTQVTGELVVLRDEVPNLKDQGCDNVWPGQIHSMAQEAVIDGGYGTTVK
jgi:hypothetical protein